MAKRKHPFNGISVAENKEARGEMAGLYEVNRKVTSAKITAQNNSGMQKGISKHVASQAL